MQIWGIVQSIKHSGTHTYILFLQTHFFSLLCDNVHVCILGFTMNLKLTKEPKSKHQILCQTIIPSWVQPMKMSLKSNKVWMPLKIPCMAYAFISSILSVCVADFLSMTKNLRFALCIKIANVHFITNAHVTQVLMLTAQCHMPYEPQKLLPAPVECAWLWCTPCLATETYCELLITPHTFCLKSSHTHTITISHNIQNKLMHYAFIRA